MKIKQLKIVDYKKWNDFVLLSNQGSVFSNTNYIQILAVDFKILSVIDNNNSILAGIVLTKNHINLYSNPFFDKYLGILYKDSSNLSQKQLSKQYKLTKLLVNELKEIKSFDYYFHPEFINWINFYWSGFTQQTRYTYVINLQNSIDLIYNNFNDKIKNDIKNAQKNNIQIKFDIPFSNFYNIINKTFKRQGSDAPFDKKRLENLFNSEFFTSVAALNNNNEFIAVCGLINDKKSSYLILNGIDIEKHVRGANSLIIFEAIKFYKIKCSSFDFEGSMINGVEQFYRRFGGELTPYMRIWNDNLFNYLKSKLKTIYKKFKFGR